MAACEMGECAQYQAWQEAEWADATHSSATILSHSEEKVAQCMEVNGCIFDQTVAVEITGAQNA